MTTVVEVPEHRGSTAPDAARLATGAARLAAMIPADRHVRVEPGATLADTAARVRAALPDDDFTCTVGGDCGIELAAIQAALERHGDRLAVAWFDAHPDMNTPETSPSGAFHGMILRALQGEGPDGLTAAPALRPSRIALAGARSIDPGEAKHIARHGIGGLDTLDPDAVVYVHVDLDVLDGITAVCYPEPGGLTPKALLEAVIGLASRHEIAGIGITEYAPSAADPASDPDEAMLRILVPALVQACTV
ncbi:hypothetical protein GCM10009853_017000 [Glycomyces scopariae]